MGVLPTRHFAEFLLTVYVLILIPGPSVLFVVSRGVALGRRAALATVLGNATGFALQLTLVSLGVGAIVAESDAVFTALKLIGAAYLVFLGAICIAIALLSDGAWALASGTACAEIATASAPAVPEGLPRKRQPRPGRANAGDRRERLCDPARGPQIGRRQRAVRDQVKQVVGTLEQAVTGGADRLDVKHGVVVAKRSERVAGERQHDRAEVSRERAGGLEDASECVTVAGGERLESLCRCVDPVRRDRRDGAEIEHRDPAVSEDEHVVRIDIRVRESERALCAEGEPHERLTCGVTALTGVAQCHAVDPLADGDAGTREPRDRRRHDDLRVTPERAMKPPLDASLVLEVKFVEHALANLAQERGRVDRRERGGERGEQTLQEREVLPDRGGKSRPQHLDGDGVTVQHPPVDLGTRRHGDWLRIELVEFVGRLGAPRVAQRAFDLAERDRLAGGVGRGPQLLDDRLAPGERDPRELERPLDLRERDQTARRGARKTEPNPEQRVEAAGDVVGHAVSR